jgi:hypothetical protein
MRVHQEGRMITRLNLAYVVMTILLFTHGRAKSPAVLILLLTLLAVNCCTSIFQIFTYNPPATGKLIHYLGLGGG